MLSVLIVQMSYLNEYRKAISDDLAQVRLQFATATLNL